MILLHFLSFPRKHTLQLLLIMEKTGLFFLKDVSSQPPKFFYILDLEFVEFNSIAQVTSLTNNSILYIIEKLSN